MILLNRLIFVLWVYIKMQITLYKSCPIGNDYKVVWNNATALKQDLTNVETAHDKLLNSLSKKVIQIDDIYLDDSGELYLDIEDIVNTDWFTDYNYMSYEIQVTSGNSHKSTAYMDNATLSMNYIYKNALKQIVSSTIPTAYYPIKKVNYLKRYAFIDSIEYSDDSIKIKYSCDIWSTYSPFIEYGTGEIVRFSDECIYKCKKSAELHTLALEDDYFANSELKKLNLSGSNISNNLSENQDCYCFATIQYYDTDNSGKQTERWLDTIMIAKGNSNQIGGFNPSTFIAKVDEWNKRIVELMLGQSTKKTELDRYYEIQDVYFIPCNMNTQTGDYSFANWLEQLCGNNAQQYLWGLACSDYILYDETDSQGQVINTYYYYLMSLQQYCDFVNYPNKLKHSFEIMSGTLSNDFKRAGIGFYTKMIQIECNNPLLELNYSIRFTFDCCNINIYLEVNNKIIELTDELSVKIPIQIATADATQLQAIQREIANKKNISSGVFGAVKGIGTSVVGGVLGGAIGGGAIASGILNTAQSITNAVLDDKLINAKAYTTNSSIDANSIGYLNAYYGFLDFYIESINDDEVNATNTKKGYIYNAPSSINSSFIDFYPIGIIPEMCDAGAGNIDSKIRYIQMKNVFIKGMFSQEIRNKLISIISNGFRFVTSSKATTYETYL